jgi:hypothetical protein
VADSFWKSGFTKKESQTMLREMGFALKDVKRAMNNWLGTTFSDPKLLNENETAEMDREGFIFPIKARK